MPKESNTRRFRVLEGAHAEEDRVYRKGEVVESDVDLIKLFPNKFEEAGVKKKDRDAEVDPAETKIVVDGGRTGETNASTSRSTTTQSAGPVAADWAVTERAGKGSEVEKAPEPKDDDDDDEDEDADKEGTKATGTSGRRRKRKSSQ